MLSTTTKNDGPTASLDGRCLFISRNSGEPSQLALSCVASTGGGVSHTTLTPPPSYHESDARIIAEKAKEETYADPTLPEMQCAN